MRHLILLVTLLLSSTIYSQLNRTVTLLSTFDPPTSDLPQSGGVQFNDVWGYTSPAGSEIAILGNVDYVVFVDVTDPANPTEIHRHAPGNTSWWRDFKTYKQYAYGVCDQFSCGEGLQIYDLGNIDCSGEIMNLGGITAQFTRSHNIFIDEPNHKLYAVGLRQSTDIYIYDLEPDPANPVLLASVNFNDVLSNNGDYYVHDIYVRDNIAYCSHGFTGFYIWDLSDLSNTNNTPANGGTIQLLASDDYNGYNHSSWVTEDGQYAINAEEVPQGQELISVDISQMTSGNIFDVDMFSHSLESSGRPTPHNPYIRNDFLYISYYEDGFKVFDFSDPTAPTLYGNYDTYPLNQGGYSGTEGAWGCYPFFPSGNVLITDITFGLHVFKVNGTENCADGILNQDETGVDCGGKYCLPCDTCFDGIKNQDETGIDCGGSICCNICPPPTADCDDVSLIIDSNITNDRDEYYSDFVETSGAVIQQSPADAKFHAGNYLQLNAGFEVMQGAQLLLVIEDCQ